MTFPVYQLVFVGFFLSQNSLVLGVSFKWKNKLVSVLSRVACKCYCYFLSDITAVYV